MSIRLFREGNRALGGFIEERVVHVYVGRFVVEVTW